MTLWNLYKLQLMYKIMQQNEMLRRVSFLSSRRDLRFRARCAVFRSLVFKHLLQKEGFDSWQVISLALRIGLGKKRWKYVWAKEGGRKARKASFNIFVG